MSRPGKRPLTDVCLRCEAVYWTAYGHTCGHRVTWIRGFLAWLAGCLLIPLPGEHANRCHCPLCSRAEREAREEMGVPLRHPERVTSNLRARDEDYLDELAERLWPEDDYIAILADPWQEDYS